MRAPSAKARVSRYRIGVAGSNGRFFRGLESDLYVAETAKPAFTVFAIPIPHEQQRNNITLHLNTHLEQYPRTNMVGCHYSGVV